MTEQHEPPAVYLQVLKERRCPHCGGQARLLVDIDTGYPQLNLQGRAQYFCLQCDRISPGKRIVRMLTSRVQEPSPLCRLYALGQFCLECRTEQQQWQSIPDTMIMEHQQALSLLSCLASSPGRTIGRDQAIDLLWPNLDVEAASHSLDMTVTRLRSLLNLEHSQNLLLSEHQTIQLADQSQVWVDADAFEALLDQARASNPGQPERLLEEALVLYGGDYLPGERMLPVVQARRESLQHSWIGLLLELADLRITREALSSAIDTLDRLLAVDPANEAAVQRLIPLLTQVGRYVEAKRIYQRFVVVLRQEYKIAPLPETRAMYEAI
jgi:DNA-binding SARP family transcriptional activator